MNLTHLHLILNHFPIIGTLTGSALMAYAILSKTTTLQKPVLAVWVVMTLLTIPLMKTGEEAEETIENIPGISESTIHEHEEAAELAFWFMMGLGVLSLVTLYSLSSGKKNARLLVRLTFVLSLLVFILMARTGYLGGMIRHTELHSGQTSPAGSTMQTENDEGED